MNLLALQTLREIAETAEPVVLQGLVAKLEKQAAECVLLIRHNLHEQPAQVINALGAKFPILITLALNPQAETVIARIIETLKRGSNDLKGRQASLRS